MFIDSKILPRIPVFLLTAEFAEIAEVMIAIKHYHSLRPLRAQR